jgi:hypothetical protein
VSDEELARSAAAEHVSLKLAQGLKACRSMIADYRAMLNAETNDNDSEAPAEPAVPSEANEA